MIYIFNFSQNTGNTTNITDEEFISLEINRFKASKRRNSMINGEKYYVGQHDILKRKRTVIGENGELITVSNLPNNKIVNNQYKKMVDQKCNYLLGQPLSINCENKQYSKLIRQLINKRFNRLIKYIAEDSLNNGIAWLFIHYDDTGKLAFKRLEPSEIIAGWKDAEHTILDYVIRIYEVISIEGKTEKTIEKVEIYDDNGISYFELENNKLIAYEPFQTDYFTMSNDKGSQGYNWSKIPIIPFKYNNKEIPLINMVKSLQDGINTILSNFQNKMEEDSHNTILVLVNFDGEDLGEFRHNLATFGAVKVRSENGSNGDIKTLQVEVNAENYKSILDILKKAIIENAMGYDAKDDRLAGSPNQMNIKSMYSDIDLDANNMETEFQASFEELLWFVNVHLFNSALGDFEKEQIEFIFNRDMLINKSEIIDNCAKSISLLSNKTVISNHPWVDDPILELDRLQQEIELE